MPLIISTVRLPFSPEEWCSIGMCEGDHYIGGCCGTTSAAQDIIEHVFRLGNGWITARELIDLAETLASHDEDEQNPYLFCRLASPVEEAVATAERDWVKLDPWSKIALVWHITKDHLVHDVPKGAGRHLSELDAASGVIARSLDALAWDRVFARDEPMTSQRKAGIALVLARIIPALKIVWERIVSLDPGPVEGCALIDKDNGPEAIASNGRGLCIYATREEVDRILSLWREQEQEYEERLERKRPVDERIGVRRVRVTLEKGVEFLDTVDTEQA